MGRRIHHHLVHGVRVGDGIVVGMNSGGDMEVKLVWLWQYAVGEVNAIAWTAVVVVTVILLRRMARLLRLWFMGTRLPGPPFCSLVGRSVFKANAEGPDKSLEVLTALHKQHGPIVKIWMAPTQLLVSITEMKLVKQVLEQANARVQASGTALELAFGKRSLFFSQFSEVEKPRAFLYGELNEKLLGQVHAVSLKVAEHMKLWAEPRKGNSWEMECKSGSQHMAFAVLGRSFFGESYIVGPTISEFEKLSVSVANELFYWMRYPVLGPIWNLRFSIFKRKCKRLQSLAEEMVSQASKELESGFQDSSTWLTSESSHVNNVENSKLSAEGSSSKGALGFMKALIESVALDKMVAAERVKGMVFHGSLTVAGLLSGVLTHLVQHPEIQAKIHSEIDGVCEHNSPPSREDLERMHYLMATVQESARLLPRSPFLQRCAVGHDLKLDNGVVVPAGAIVGVPVQLLQLDPGWWGDDATTFNPERFLQCPGTCLVDRGRSQGESEAPQALMEGQSIDEGCNNAKKDPLEMKGSVVQDPQSHPAFLLFGAGSRACVGRNFALVAITSLLASLLQRFELKLVPGSKDMKPKLENCVLQFSPSARVMLVHRRE